MKTKTAQKRGKQTTNRLAANKCERKRVKKLNEAFEILKKHVQSHNPAIEMRTKHDVLKSATDYIQILQKIAAQSEAVVNLLRAPPLETESIDSIQLIDSKTERNEMDSPKLSIEWNRLTDSNTEWSEMESPRPSIDWNRLTDSNTEWNEMESPGALNEPFPAELERCLPSFQQQESLMERTSPTLSDSVIFEGFDFTDEQNLTGPYRTWWDGQPIFRQVQFPEHNHKITQNIQLQSCSFAESQELLLPYWLNQDNHIPEERIVFNELTVFDSDEDELIAWLYS